jgi:hypothetical protein
MYYIIRGKVFELNSYKWYNFINMIGLAERALSEVGPAFLEAEQANFPNVNAYTLHIWQRYWHTPLLQHVRQVPIVVDGFRVEGPLFARMAFNKGGALGTHLITHFATPEQRRAVLFAEGYPGMTYAQLEELGSPDTPTARVYGKLLTKWQAELCPVEAYMPQLRAGLALVLETTAVSEAA